MTRPFEKSTPIHYPSSDGKPMADNTRQWNWITFIKNNIEEITKGKQIFVASDLLWYPVEGNNKFRIAPDVMVAIGRPKGDRNSYLQWKEEHIVPQQVWEILSPSNSKKEMARKLALYESLGVQEYYVYDPDVNQLEIYLRKEKQLQRQDVGKWTSPLLQFSLVLTKDTLKLYQPSGELFRSFGELVTEASEARKDASLARKDASIAKKDASLARKDAAKAQKKAIEAQKAADAAKKKAALLAAKLKELGIDPDTLE